MRREAGEVGKDRRIVPETLVCSGPEASGGFRGPQRRSGATYIQSGAWPGRQTHRGYAVIARHCEVEKMTE